METFFLNDKNKFIRFLLTLFLGWIGSFIINNTSLKPEGFKSRTFAYFFLTFFTFGIYGFVASICNFSFDPKKPSNIGYFRDGTMKVGETTNDKLDILLDAPNIDSTNIIQNKRIVNGKVVEDINIKDGKMINSENFDNQSIENLEEFGENFNTYKKKFIICNYCKSKIRASGTKCENCGAPITDIEF